MIFYLIYLLNIIICNRVLSYFTKPNFIVYNEWFDNELKITPDEKYESKTTNKPIVLEKKF